VLPRLSFPLPVLLALCVRVLDAQSAADARWIAQCRDHSGDWQVKHCEARVVTLAKGGAITVDPGENGGVTVEGWTRDSIEVHARRVSFVIYAPRRSDLTLDTHNGPICVRDVTGRMALTAYNGPVSLDGVGGDVHARTTNGPIDIELTGERWEGAGLDAETTNGPLELAIPESYSARLEFGTVNGPMSVGFPLTVTIQGRVGRRITTTLGAGGAPVRAVTTNGPVEIRRN